MLSPEEIRNQCEDDADRAPSDLTVWRDRGEIIAAQQTRIAQLEAQIARVEAAERRLWAEGGDPMCGETIGAIYRHICAQFREALS